MFDFFRNDVLDANSFFSNRVGLRKPPLRWNQYGANLGGPIRRNRLFFFFNYEGAQASVNAPQTGNVPTPLLLQMVTPALRQNLQLLPSPTSSTSNPLVGLNFHNANRTNDENTFVSRGDAEFAKHRLSVRYNYNHQNFTTPNLIPTSTSNFPTRFHNAAIEDVSTITPTMVNELRLGFNRLDEFRHDTLAAAIPASLTISEAGIGTGMDFLRFDSDSYTLADNLTIIHRNHTLKTGFEIRSLRTHRFDYSVPGSTYLTLAHLIVDTPDSVGVNFDGPRALHNADSGFFFQDNWRVSKRLQVNAGLRYEYFSPFKGAWNVSTRDPFGPFIANKSEDLYQPDYTDFSPRLGLVLDVFGDQKLIVRAGGALTYNPLQAEGIYDLSFTSNPRLPATASFLPSDLPPGTNLSFPFNASFLAPYVANPNSLPANIILSRSLLDPNRRDERSGTWNLSVQRAITSNLAFQASYVGTRNWDQYGSRNLNLFIPALNARLHPDLSSVTYREYAGRSSYHAMQLSLNQRLQHGLTLDFYYAYAKSLSYYGADSGGVGDASVQDANNIAGSYGPKVTDIRHSEVMVVSYAVPGPGFIAKSPVGKAFLSGWNVQAIQNEYSGLPINVLAGVDEAGIKTTGLQRPDLVPGVPQYIRDLNTLQWLNRAAFDVKTPAAQQRYGNLGFGALRGPSAFSFDFALHKSFIVHEKQTLTFRAEAFSVLNHVRLNRPNSSVASPTFGLITSGSDGRNVQLALKYRF